MDVDLPVAEQPGRDLFDDAEPERLEDRHERREIHLPTGLVELDARESLAGRLVAETDDEPLVVLLHLVELEDVVDDQRPVAVGLVVLGEAGRVPVGERRTAVGADPRHQRVAEVVVPGAREPFDLLLQLLVRHLRDLHAGVDVDREEDARVLRLAEREVIVDRGAVEPVLEQVLQALAQPRVEPIPRERHDDRDAPAVEVATHQHADAAVPLQLEQPADQPAELAGRRLEQLVLRERLEQRRGGLVVVRSRDQILRGEHLLELVVQERRLRGGLHVRLRREEPDHAGLADDLAVGAHVPYADVVHASAPVDRRVRVGLREDQQVAVLDASAQSRLERVQQRRVGERRPVDVGQDAETAPGRGADGAAIGRVDQLVLAIAQEDEVQLEEPVEEVDRLADLLRGVAHGGEARELQHVVGAILHRLEVAHHQPDVTQDRLDPFFQVGSGRVDQTAIELEVHDRLAVRGVPSRGDTLQTSLLVARRADDRVQDPAHDQVPSGELLGDGVDQERRVVDVRLEDRARSREPVRRDLGVERADHPRVQPASVHELERGADEAVELLRGGGPDLVVRQASQVRLRERGHGLPSLDGDALIDEGQQWAERRTGLCAGCGGGGPIARLRDLATARSLHRVRHVASRVRFWSRAVIVTDAGVRRYVSAPRRRGRTRKSGLSASVVRKRARDLRPSPGGNPPSRLLEGRWVSNAYASWWEKGRPRGRVCSASCWRTRATTWSPKRRPRWSSRSGW